MCECNCFSSAGTFRLRAPDGWYRILLTPACDDCGHGGGMTIQHASDGDELVPLDADEMLNVGPDGGEAHFITGPSNDDIKHACLKVLVGFESLSTRIDENEAEELAYDLARAMRIAPQYAPVKEPNRKDHDD